MENKDSQKGAYLQPRGREQIDISLIDYALSLSYEDRIEAHESARELMEDLRKAGEALRETRPERST